MWKLTIEDDEAKQTSLPLAHDEYGIGRAEHNAIRLTDRNVSRKHAALLRNSQGWLVRDNDSYNGTYVNGLRVVGEQHVQSGDIIQLGDYRLELVDESKAHDHSAGLVPVHQRPDRLVVVVGPTPGAEFPLDREHFTIGRAEDAEISINHSSVSRFHAELFGVGNSRYEIIDKNSANGIRINGQEIKRGFLEPGDALELGDVRLRFVGRGKIFRAGADQSQQLAVASFESVAPSVRAPAMQAQGGKGVGIGKFIGIGAALGLIAIAVLLIAMRSGPAETQPQNPETTPENERGDTEPETTDSAEKVLEEAVELLDAGKIQKAHEKALEIPEGSSLRESDEFKRIERRWADWIFRQVTAESDPQTQYEMLLLIVKTPTVDAQQRRNASNMLGSIEEKEPEVKQKAKIWQPPKDAVAPQDIYDPSPPPAVSSDDGEDEETPPKPGEPGYYEYQVKALMPKMTNGTATEKELQMLRGACQQTGNTACRDAANQQLQAMKK